MKRIPLTQGIFTVVDNDDYEKINQHKWHVLKGNYTFYAVRKTSRKEGSKMIFMHREILGLQPGDGITTDHRDHNGLNNRSNNIRTCTKGENAMNAHPWKTKASRFKGIRPGRTGKGWCARIKFQGKMTHIGTFDTEIEAAEAYDRVAIELFGEFALINFPKKFEMITGTQAAAELVGKSARSQMP